MNSELVVDVQQKEITIALLEDKNLVELNKEGRSLSFMVGDIYVGRVKKLMPGLNAAFVDVGYGKEAFLHYQDLGPQFLSQTEFFKQTQADRKRTPSILKSKSLPDIPKDGTISDVLKVGQELWVQIAKEPISTKGPRLSAELSIAGRYLVLIPFSDKVSVSQKIKSSEERMRLKQLIQSIKPRRFGVIVRTVAEEKRVAELDNELRILVKRWEESVAKTQKAKGIAPVLEEIGRTIGIIRDIFNPDFESIHINDEAVCAEVRDYVELIAPDKKNIIKLYDGKLPIFDNFAITKQIKALFGKTVTFKRGAYLIIEQTEAMHVIDVNSGNRSKANNNQEDNALEVNMAAANEIVRQMRLRDLGGIIAIDFIDMLRSEHRQQLFDHVEKLMENDRAKHHVLPLSKFGVMQITRQRVRPAMFVDTEETCPTCFGSGKIKASILFTDTLEGKLDYLVNTLNVKQFVLKVHPYVAAYINSGFYSLKWKWKFRYGFSHKIVPSQEFGLLQYAFIDAAGNELDLKEEIETRQ
ncbi:MAG: ribonuclease, Rne/Rng family [Bacteroidetes bacterium]|nr:ribonuclease, Rne/Rng family [Bacteroidota bacterium]